MCNITHDSVLLTNDYVSGNLRLVFKYTPPDIYDVDLIDYPLIKKMKMKKLYSQITWLGVGLDSLREEIAHARSCG